MVRSGGPHKSFRHFSNNLNADRRAQISHILRLQPATETGEYLGAPLYIPRSKNIACREVQEKVAKRLAGWKARALSQAERTVLLQSVAQAIPSYLMSVFLFSEECESRSRHPDEEFLVGL